MKSVFFAVAVMFATAAFAQDGTKSVLANAPTVAADASSAAPKPAAADVQCCESAKLVRLAPWQVRRLNRIADRQEAREAKKCCCPGKSDKCKCDCRKAATVVVESR